MEGLRICHIIHCAVKSPDNCRRQGLCHITDSQSDNVRIWIFLLIVSYLFRYVGKQIASLKLQIIIIDRKHITFLLYT